MVMETGLQKQSADIFAELERVGGAPDETIDVAEVALLLGALDRPGVPLDRYRHHLGRLVKEFEGVTALSSRARGEALASFLAGDKDYRGDEESYDNLENANLLSVIDRRRGLPVSLAIIYLHVARSRGWDAAAVNFPGHVLFRIDGDKDRTMIDPFRGGALIDAQGLRELLKKTAGTQAELKPEFYEPLGNRALLLRLQNNIKVRALKLGDMDKAVDVLRRMVAIAPMEVEAWYELGVLLIHQEKLREGRDALETCLARIDYVDGRVGLRGQVLQTLSELSASLDG